MSARDKIAKLEGLLERVKQNARAPRVRAPHPAPPAAETLGDLGAGAAAASPPAPPVAVRAAEEVSSVSVDLDEVVLIEEEEIFEIPPDARSERPPPAAASPAPPEAAPAALAAPVPPAPAAPEPSEAASGVIDIDFDDVEDLVTEEPPASSRRPKLPAESMDAALTDAVERLDEEREVPLKTPPPESGPQEALPPPQALQAPAMPEVDELLERPVPRPAEPTPSPAEVEIAEAEPPPVSAQRTTAEAERAVARLEPEITRRPVAPAAEPVNVIAAAQRFEPKSFAELLDASLGLGR